MSLEIQKMQNENQYLQKEINMLHQKTNINFEYSKLQPDDVYGPCLCKDDARVLKKYYCDCQNLQAKRDYLKHLQVDIKVNGIYKIHQNILIKPLMVADGQTFTRELTEMSTSFVIGSTISEGLVIYKMNFG